MGREFIPRIRAAVLIVREGRILLVRERDPRDGKDFWVPPGGGQEPSDESLLAAARREVFEETGLSVESGGLAYYREFRDELRMTHWLEMFFVARAASGDIRSGVGGPSVDPLARQAQWFSRAELQPLTVYPQVLKDAFWTDYEKGFPEVRYLGLSQG